MYALLAFRRTLTQGTVTRHLVDFEIVSMGCFNGMNTGQAFVPRMAGGSRDLTIETDERGIPLRVSATTGLVKAWGGTTAEVGRMDADNRGWVESTPRCIGLGYIAYIAGSAQKTYTQLTVTGRNDINQKGSPYVGECLLREGFMTPYRSPVQGGQQASLRVLTPNEEYLKNCFYDLEIRNTHFEPTLRDTTSKLAPAVSANRIWAGGLYQWVGSERPSGQAVAYLQAWRNAAEYQTNNGFEHVKGQHQVATLVTTIGAFRNKPLIHILSHLFNAGEDSDIITFAGNHYLSYCQRVGFWNTTSLFRDQRPMTEEGRYNKGGQSTSIRDRLHTLRSMNSRRDTHALWTRDLGKQLDDMKRGYDAHSNLAYQTSASTLAAYGSNSYSNAHRQAHIDSIIGYVRAIWGQTPSEDIQVFLREANALPDLNVPVPQAEPTIPATPGFTQWVAQEITVH